MDGDLDQSDLSALRVPRVGAVVMTADVWEPVRLVDAGGVVIEPVGVFLRELDARGRSAATARSYAMDLLWWFRFLWAIGVSWDRATRAEARDFCVWMRVRRKPGREGAGGEAVNAVTGKPALGPGYAASTRAHAETVLRTFYEVHREAGTGPMVNPFPICRTLRDGRAGAHTSPMAPFPKERVGVYRPRMVTRIPRCIPDASFDALFAALGCDRDRALVALWVSSGARASELLGLRRGDVDPGQQLITVVRKGSRALQQIPASADAFVWLRLYQLALASDQQAGLDDPVWWTRRSPQRPLTYHAARAMFTRAAAALGANWTLHDLRHTAAYRMARDPGVSLTDVQWVLGHASVTTTQRYLTPLPADVIADVLAHHARRREQAATGTSGGPGGPGPDVGYRSDSLDVLFGNRGREAGTPC